MPYTLEKQVRDRAPLRRSFFALAEEVFGLSFESWYENGYWTGNYLPYALADGGKVVANASVNRMDFTWRGTPRRYIQIGTVMTAPAYRGQGLSRRLIEEILADWEGACDGLYLFANDTVLDFYPKFGFEKAAEYQYTLPVSPAAGDFRRLDMGREEDRRTLLRCYRKSNPFSALAFCQNEELLMFYCGAFLKDSVYYSPELDMAGIAEQEGDTLLCHDLFGEGACSLAQAVSRLAAPGTTRAVLHFTPKETAGCLCAPLEGEDTLFILRGKENIFRAEKAMFPSLSHA